MYTGLIGGIAIYYLDNKLERLKGTSPKIVFALQNF